MVEKFELESKQLDRNMNLHVYLPEEYEESEEKYPVVYMLDGHNLFFDEDATFGTSWGLKDFLDSYDKPIIVVGIECDHRGQNRLQEYCPYPLKDTFFGEANGKGKDFFDWLIEDLKPYVDQKYRTWPHREATAIAGSSMGGLMSAYALARHNDVFSKAAALSPSILIAKEPFLKDVDTYMVNPDTTLFLSFGEKELSGNYAKTAEKEMKDLEALLEGKGMKVMSLIQKEGGHNEESWSRLNPIWLDFLWK